jgi:hypothetical protein
MELDIHLKTGDCSVLFSFEKPSKLWSYSFQRTQDWNVEYMLVERIVREFSFLHLNVTVITSYITDKKWTDEYVTSLDKIGAGLQKNEERILKLIDKTESVINDPSKRLKIVSGGRVFTEKDAEQPQPVTIIEEHLHKNPEEPVVPNKNTEPLIKKTRAKKVKTKKK